MNNKGSVRENSLFRRIKVFSNRVGTSYIYKLVSKILSFLGTIFLIFLVVIGSLMFYFNTKAKSYQKKGVNYVPPFGLYTIISGSMEPSIRVYDVVVSVSERDLSKVKVGDIITFISTWDVNYGKTITHRVVSVSKNTRGEYQFTTKGDNNEASDGAVVNQSNFVGKVVMRLPQLGRLQFFLATRFGWFMVVFIPALGVIIYDMFKIFKLAVLKREINNVSNVGDLNAEELVVVPTSQGPTYEVQTSEELLAKNANETFNSYEVGNVLNDRPSDVQPAEVVAPIVNQTPIVAMPDTPVPQTTVSSPEVVETFEIEADLPKQVETIENNVELPIVNTAAESKPVIETPQINVETNTPINNENIVQTNTNQITRAPLARRGTAEVKPEEPKQTSSVTPSKVMDLEDMVNIQLPVMKANAALGIPEEGPLNKRL